MKKKANKEPKEMKIDLPEVKDIPGQEHIKPPKMREMNDETISSADEEGDGILDELNGEDDLNLDDRSNVSPTEKELLSKADRIETEEDRDLETMELDETDEDGDELSETSDPLDMGEDLDVPGADLDDEDEELGEEDEENNPYSGRD